MTSKLYCPFCHRALSRHGVQCKEYGACRGENCPSERNFLPIEIWQALIQAKQDLEIAKSYIKGISQMVINSGDNIYIVIGHFKKLAEQTLEQIEHKGQQCQI